MTLAYSKEHFIQFALDAGVLGFGQFTLKSGRKSPYFFNAGKFYHGQNLKILGEFYAHTLLQRQPCASVHLFGPAYKGIPLATATAIALAGLNIDSAITYNRKEAKDHGEGGTLVGAPVSDHMIMIDDVITAGTAFRESLHLINTAQGQLKSIIIALDRCERGTGEVSAIEQISATGVQVFSIITVYDLIAYLEKQQEKEAVRLLRSYQEEYGTLQ